MSYHKVIFRRTAHYALAFGLATGTLGSLGGCTSTRTMHAQTSDSDASDDELSDRTVQRGISVAESLYAVGVQQNLTQRWSDAQVSFEKSFGLLAELDLPEDETSPLYRRADRLLQEINADYQVTLAHLDQLSGETSPAGLTLKGDRSKLSPQANAEIDRLLSQIRQDAAMSYDVPIAWNDRVKEKVVFFQTTGRAPMEKYLRQAGKYQPMARRIFKEYGLPLDLTYLAVIESGYNPHAYSWAKAAGIWQFIKGTGVLYGLKQSWWFDERRDPEKSTRAAAGYLKKLYGDFGSWELALAAYNCGEGAVGRRLKAQGVTEYWSLKLPQQTMDYVPLYMAAVIIGKNPELYGFAGVRLDPEWDFEYAEIPGGADLLTLAKCGTLEVDVLKDFNPELTRGTIPFGVDKYKLRVPRGYAGTLTTALARIPADQRLTSVAHTVKKGETLSKIARLYGVSAQAIAEANDLGRDRSLSPGQTIHIPVDPNAARDLSSPDSRLAGSDR